MTATPPQNCTDGHPPCDMDLGAVSMPLVKAKLQEIGRQILDHHKNHSSKWASKTDDVLLGQQQTWSLSTSLINLSFAASGAVTSLVDRSTGRNVLSPTDRSSLVTVSFPPRLCPPGHMGACPPCICAPVPASAVTCSGTTLRATVPMRGSARLEVVMAVDSGFPADSLVFSVMALACSNCTTLDNWGQMVRLNLLNLSVALPMCANSAAASYNSTFGITLVPADYYSTTSGITNAISTSCNLLASSFPASARCLAAAGAHCGSASLWGGPRSGLLPSIEAAEVAFQLPSPRTVNGTWLKRSAAASTGYIMLSGVDISNFESAIDLAKASGMKMVVLLNCVANSGHFSISEDAWNGTVGLAAAIRQAHAQGIKVGLHTMSASIPVQDGYITPTPDPRLAALDGWVLQAGINASTTSILLNKLVPAGWGLGTTLRIGDELVTFTSSEALGKLSTLSGVVRGAYNTTAVGHLDGAQVFHLHEMFGFRKYQQQTVPVTMLLPSQVFDRRLCLCVCFPVPDPNTDLLEEIGANLAAVVDAVDCDYVYFDGIEGLSIWGNPTMSRLHRAFWAPVQRKDIIVQSSGNFGELWHLNTRSGPCWHKAIGERRTPDLVLFVLQFCQCRGGLAKPAGTRCRLVAIQRLRGRELLRDHSGRG